MAYDSYHYHVFLSYHRDGDVEDWVENHFEEQLRKKLTEALGETAQIFRDRPQMRAGDVWRPTLCEALLTSCCLVPIFSPTYFKSEFCAAEWATFRERRRALGLSTQELIAPVLWQEHQDAPAAFGETTYETFSDVAYSTKPYKDDPKYLVFEDRVRKFAAQVAAIVARAPDFDPQWPVIFPERFDGIDTLGIRIQLLLEHEHRGQVLLPRRSRIGKPNLAGPRQGKAA